MTMERVFLGPSGEYYKKLFNEEDGDCYDIRQMVEATQIFNPIFLKDMSDTDVCTVLYNLADKLKYFHYDKTITDQLLDNLKKEMPKFVKEAKRDHDLDCIPASKRYKTRLQERIKKKNLPEGSTLDWKDDPGEYAERIWYWWKSRITQFPIHAMVLRIVVLVQFFSCCIERVFSKLKHIRDRCGESLYDDMCEIRLFFAVQWGSVWFV